MTAPRAQSSQSAALKRELDLARKEGIPTTAAEFRATIKIPALPEYNAAPYYRALIKAGRPPSDIGKLNWHVNWDSSPSAVTDARAMLQRYKPWLDLGDQIAKCEQLWMDRPWEDGIGVVYTEMAQARYLAQLMLLRGSLAVREGHPDQAAADANAAWLIGTHFQAEPTLVARLMANSICPIVHFRLAEWVYLHPNDPTYRRTLIIALNGWPLPDFRKEASANLYQWLLLMDQVQTKQGRQMIGLREDERAPGDAMMAGVQPLETGKLLFVKAFRKYWKALYPFKQAAATQAKVEMMNGLMSAPTAVKVIESIFDFDRPESDRTNLRLTRGSMFWMFLDAAKQGFPKELSTTSNFNYIDNKPIRYSSDGTQVKLSAGVYNGVEIQLTIPPKRPQ